MLVCVVCLALTNDNNSFYNFFFSGIETTSDKWQYHLKWWIFRHPSIAKVSFMILDFQARVDSNPNNGLFKFGLNSKQLV